MKINSKRYQEFANSVDREDEGYLHHNKSTYTASHGRLINGALGLAGECGEVVDIIKKHTQFGKPLDDNKLKEELGDILWYMAIILTDIGSSFEEVMQLNQNKLEKRFPKGFSQADALNRADEK